MIIGGDTNIKYKVCISSLVLVTVETIPVTPHMIGATVEAEVGEE